LDRRGLHGRAVLRPLLGDDVLRRGFERYFGLSTVLPIPAGCRLPVTPMADGEIDALKRNIRNAVTESHAMTYAMLPERLRIDPIEWVAMQQVAA
jgi:hypothetical protein